MVFATDGFAAASLVQILAQAGFARSSFYHYFGTKNALFDAAFQDGIEQLARQVEVPDLQSCTREDFWQGLLAFARSMSGVGRDHGLAAVGTMFHLSDAPESTPLAQFRESARSWCHDAVRTGAALGCLDPDLPEDLAIDLAWNALQSIDRWFLEHGEVATDSATLTHRILYGLLGPHPHPPLTS